MKTFLKVTIFSLAVIIFYAFYAGSMIPQVKPAPPPTEAKLDMGSLTMEQFIQMGDEIFHVKGTCELCHNPVGGRAPLLDQVGKVAEERLKDPRYKGKAKTGEEAECRGLHEHSEPVFNAAWSKRRQFSCRPE